MLALGAQDLFVQQLGEILDGIDTMFTAVFTLELLVNMYAHWFRPFWRDGWSIFDFLVIALSLVALGPVNMPISVIRLMRTFRVVRLFGRMRALRQIILALTASLVPVTNAFFILLIVIAICAPSQISRPPPCARCPPASSFCVPATPSPASTLRIFPLSCLCRSLLSLCPSESPPTHPRPLSNSFAPFSASSLPRSLARPLH